MIRIIALAPLIVDLSIGAIVLVTDSWDWIKNNVRYYLQFVILIFWVLYSHVSPSDLRSALHPGEGTH